MPGERDGTRAAGYGGVPERRMAPAYRQWPHVECPRTRHADGPGRWRLFQRRLLQSRYGNKVNARDFDGQVHMISEMDALVAYLQVLGTMVDFEQGKKVEGGAK